MGETESVYNWRGDPNLSSTGDRDYLAQLILHLTNEIHSEPDSARVRFLRGNAYLDSGQFEDAVSDYSAAIEVADEDDPQKAIFHNNRGIALRYLSRFDDAIRDYDHALRLDPRYRDALTNRGIARADTGDLTGAVDDFSAAIEVDSQSWYAYSQRGLVLWALGRRDEAEADYAAVRRLQT